MTVHRPSHVVRIADHLFEYITLLSEEVGCTKSEALDCIVEDWLDRPRDDQPVSLLSALRRHGWRWSDVRMEAASLGMARDALQKPKTASQYLEELET